MRNDHFSSLIAVAIQKIMKELSLVTGFPRVGENRELKKAVEAYWAALARMERGESAADPENAKAGLLVTAKLLRERHWSFQKSVGVDIISCNDFSLYDGMLDTACMLGLVPQRFASIADPLERYFAMARGAAQAPAMQMTKWFNSNYHYIVPELEDGMIPKLNPSKILEESFEGRAVMGRSNTLDGRPTSSLKVNLIGPITFLALAKRTGGGDGLPWFERILPLYLELVSRLTAIEATVVMQFEEPIFAKDPTDERLALLKSAYDRIAERAGQARILVTTYFGRSNEATAVLAKTPVWGVGLDFVYGPENEVSLACLNGKKLIAGVIDGRNIWATDLERCRDTLRRIEQQVAKQDIIVSTSCSLLHVPYSAAAEPDSPVKPWLSFAYEKTRELVVAAESFHQPDNTEIRSGETFVRCVQASRDRAASPLVHDSAVAARESEDGRLSARHGSHEMRRAAQEAALGLPLLPTTTIGSFPQTAELRGLRADHKKRLIRDADYEAGIRAEIDKCVAIQEELGLDVLVHGESERNDMVEYFGELLKGFHFTSNGWVQSYGSRCVKPPIIYGDVSRPKPMTVKWIAYAQGKTRKPMKGMLTGPVTILNWSFVRDDKPRSKVARQIAFALADEVADLQAAGIKIIQVDEAAFREGYPLRMADIPAYEEWAVASFKLAVSPAKPETQIHTHMCYSDFHDSLQALQAMDADVITIETARSGDELLKAFSSAPNAYRNEIGPGVYDIHSPRVPSVEEIKQHIQARLAVFSKRQLWVNPDCGLKTRGWDEVKLALRNMVHAAKEARGS
jgi:5-methyltetrahydropteroyltriglutamate--homocysteine methyltransferase